LASSFTKLVNCLEGGNSASGNRYDPNSRLKCVFYELSHFVMCNARSRLKLSEPPRLHFSQPNSDPKVLTCADPKLGLNCGNPYFMSVPDRFLPNPKPRFHRQLRAGMRRKAIRACSTTAGFDARSLRSVVESQPWRLAHKILIS